MQALTRDALLAKAAQLFSEGVADRAFGWKRGEFVYDVTPALFRSAEEMEKDFVCDDFCGANFSKYLVEETRKGDGKVLVFLKPCDTYSLNQLLTEHRLDRDKVYAVAIPCAGMADVSRVREMAGEGVRGIRAEGDELVIGTLYDGEVRAKRESLLEERCRTCKSAVPVAYDEILGEPDGKGGEDRFETVAKLEAMTPDERFAFWRGELSRCIRCNACRDVCPACTCETCVFDNPKSGFENKAPADSFEEQMFHIIRAFHVAGRCTDCGECSRVCPQRIPLHLLNRKFIKDINAFYGEYQAGLEVGSRSPLIDYTPGDVEPAQAVERGNGNA